MKSANLKGKSIAISLIVLLTISAAIAILPFVQSVETYSGTPIRGSNGLWNVPMFAGLTIAPDPVGLGQSAQIIMILELLPPSQGIETVSVVTGGWLGLVLTITDPDGQVTTQGPFETDVSGTYQINFTPTKIGNYSFQFYYPGETVSDAANQGTSSFVKYYANFQSVTSPLRTLTVQTDPVQGYIEAPVPNADTYWSQPIDAQNRYWNTLCGPWLQSGYNATGAVNPYTLPVASPHILWSDSLSPVNGGLIGGDYGAYEFRRGGSGLSFVCAMGGYVYYNGLADYSLTGINGSSQSYFYCMNLETQEIMWRQPGSISQGQILNWRSQQAKNEMGYLWSLGSTYRCYSARTGQLLAEWHSLPAGSAIANATAVPAVFGGATPVAGKEPLSVTVQTGTVVLEPPHVSIGQEVNGGSGGGALLVYIYARNTGQPTGWLACWNATQAICSYQNNHQVISLDGGGGAATDLPTVANQLTTTPLDWLQGIQWNVTVPLTSLPTVIGSTNITSAIAAWSLAGCDGQYAVFHTGKSDTNATGSVIRTLAVMKVGDLPTTTTWINDVGSNVRHVTEGHFEWIKNYTLPGYDATYTGNAVLRGGGNILVCDQALLTIFCWDAATGNLKWAATPFKDDFATQSMGAGIVANNINYVNGYDGTIHALNADTGVEIWASSTAQGGLEMPQPNYPTSGITYAGGVIFTTTGKAYEAEPLYRGHKLYAFDATSGAQLWNISGQLSVSCVVDGKLLASNNYDGKVYCFGKGRSATTVTAPMTEIAAGTKAIIQGTVTDQTPGIAKDTAAVSDNDMTDWMEYMYMDQPYPTSATGVIVSIDAVDPNGNFVHIGDTHSDTTGTFSYVWTPPAIAGQYNIIASFIGSKAYYSSSGETSAVVVDAPVTTTPAPVQAAQSNTDMYVIGSTIAIIIAIAIVALLLLRKRA